MASLALVAAGCGGDDDEAFAAGDTGAAAGGGGNVEALPASSCTGIEFEGEGEPDAIIVSDLSMQGLAHPDGADDEGDPPGAQRAR